MNSAEQQSSPRKVVRIPRFVSILLTLLVAIGVAALSQQTVGSQETLKLEKVEPTVTQPESTIKLFFDKEVTVNSVTIGTVTGSFASTAPSKELEVTVPSNAAMGRQVITVEAVYVPTQSPSPTPAGAGAGTPSAGTTGAGTTGTGTTDARTTGAGTSGAGNANANAANTPQTLTGSIIVAPLITGLKANKDAAPELSRVVVANGEAILQFKEKIPAEIREKLKVTLIEVLDVNEKTQKKTPATRDIFPSVLEDSLLLTIPDDIGQDTYEVQVSADGSPLREKPKVRVEYTMTMVKRAFLVVGLVILLIYLLYKLFYKVPEGQPRYNFVKMLLLEQENQTYSLSRAQFAGWLVVIIWCYLFLYFAHGFVEENWSYPSLGNAVYAFLISLGTLVASQATSLGVGVKGAGEEHPSLADLVVHGGVLALDRVQQVIWTVIALGMFIRITVTSYSTASALPDIPPELLALMGLSSAGYLGGKLVRGPGPVIDQVIVTGGSVVLNVKGQQLSKDPFVWLDGVQLDKDKVEVVTADPDDPLKFAKELKLTLNMAEEDWYAKHHALTIVNNDAQRADWRTSAEIREVTAGQPDAQGRVPLTITTARAASGATIGVIGDQNFAAVQSGDNPNVFTASVDAEWPTKEHELVIKSEGRQSTFSYKPPV